jgi:hypothetical protein
MKPMRPALDTHPRPRSRTLELELVLVLVLVLGTTGCVTAGGAEDELVPSREPAPLPAKPPSQNATPASENLPVAPARLEAHDPRTIPGGLACLIRLRARGIEFSALPALKGVDTPVKVTGSIGGIAYRSLGGGPKPLLADCRLVLALDRAAPYLKSLEVRTMHFSNAYSYRLMPSGRLSQHAMGLAIDVHKVTIGEEVLDVQEDYELALEDGCAGPPLNRMGCLLRSWGLFDWVLTPDFDAAHRNHFHLDIYDLHRRKHLPKSAPGPAIDD